MCLPFDEKTDLAHFHHNLHSMPPKSLIADFTEFFLTSKVESCMAARIGEYVFNTF